MTAFFITGASSALGRAVVGRLRPHGELRVLEHRRAVSIPGANLVRLDGGLDAVERHREMIQSADAVLHMAAVTHADREEDYVRVNTQGTERLLRQCRPGQRFVFVSTRCIDPAGGAYSRSKQLAEQAVEGAGLSHIIVRPSEIYGSRAGEGIDRWLALALRRGWLVDFRWQPPVTYSPISLDEAADFIARVVLHPARAGACYTLCSNRSYTADDICLALRKQTRRRIRLLPVPVGLLLRLQRLGCPMPFAKDQLTRLIAPRSDDNSLAREDYGFSPKSFLDLDLPACVGPRRAS